MRVYKLDENLECRCGHIWEEHHHGVVQNPEYFDYPLTINGCIAEECEHNQVNGQYFGKREETCYCNGFKPRATNVQRILDEWVKKQEEKRKSHG